MRSLARYAATNAITRTMLSELLTREDFDDLLRSESLDGVWQALKKTSYRDWIPDDPPAQILTIERILREVTASRFKRSIHALRAQARHVGSILLSRWDLDNLELALRLWHGRDTALQRFLTYPSFVDDIPVYDISEAETLEEIALILRATPYFEPVTTSLKEYRERRTIFFVEISLEKAYYASLLGAIRDLGGSDRAKAERIVAAEIDLLNLSWLARLLEYYDIQPSGFAGYAIPGPSEISRRLASPGLTSENLNQIGSELLEGFGEGKGEGGSQLETIAFMEVMVSETAVDAARNALAGYPFSIGCVFAFYQLKRTELKNLEIVFAGKSMGADKSEISEKLYGLR
jgi:vacuolar-type H+-ATPase subunit C/Vma6